MKNNQAVYTMNQTFCKQYPRPDLKKIPPRPSDNFLNNPLGTNPT